MAGLRVVHEQGSKKVAAESSNFPSDWQHASPKSSSFYKPFNVWAPGPFVPFEAFHTNSHFSQCPVSAPRFDNWPAYWGSANSITPFAGCPAFTSKTHAAGETSALSTIPDLKWKQSFSNNLSVYCLEIDTPLWQCLRVRLRSSSGLPQLAAKLPFFECSSFPKCAFSFTNLSAKSKVGELPIRARRPLVCSIDPIRIATIGAEGCKCTWSRSAKLAHGFPRNTSLAIPRRSLFAERAVIYQKTLSTYHSWRWTQIWWPASRETVLTETLFACKGVPETAFYHPKVVVGVLGVGVWKGLPCPILRFTSLRNLNAYVSFRFVPLSDGREPLVTKAAETLRKRLNPKPQIKSKLMTLELGFCDYLRTMCDCMCMFC